MGGAERGEQRWGGQKLGGTARRVAGEGGENRAEAVGQLREGGGQRGRGRVELTGSASCSIRVLRVLQHRGPNGSMVDGVDRSHTDSTSSRAAGSRVVFNNFFDFGCLPSP